jgi:mycothiol system anti-sigma-R factor
MDCNDCREMVQRAADGELDSRQKTDLQQHVSGCPSCARALENAQALRAALHHKALKYSAPNGLKARLRAGIQPRSQVRKWIGGLAAALIVFGLGAWSYGRITTHAKQDVLLQELASAHIRSLMGNHLSDVVSTDSHTVKPWFAGKLDFSPLVADFPDKDFKLIGGRLDYVHGRAVAALVYKHRQHIINLFVWPGTEDETLNAPAVRNGYNVLSWKQNGMEFWMVSDLNPGELNELKALIEQQAVP